MAELSSDLLDTLVTDPVESAKAAGLRYVNDDEPGIRRERHGEDFAYFSAQGEEITSKRILARIEGLKIPPAWDDVWICPRPSGHLQATGRDARGRKQYIYHPEWTAFRSQNKYHRMLLFGEALPDLRQRVDADLSRRGLPRDKVLATVLKLMQMTFVRVGNKEYARNNKSYGLTTLRNKHVKIEGSTIHLHFIGKSGQKHAIDVKDRRLARIVKQCRDIPGYELFQYYDENGDKQVVDSGDVNDYLRDVTGEEFSAKDFRTWGGTVLAAAILNDMGEGETATATKKNVVEMVKSVASTLGNRPATCRKYYIHPAVLEAYQEGEFVERWRAALEGAATSGIDGLSTEETALMTLLHDHTAAGNGR